MSRLFASTNAGALLVLCTFAILGLSGCAAGPASLTFKSDKARTEFQQVFRQAYFNLSDDGRYDVVLLEDGLTPPHQRKANAPIGVSNAAPLAQTVHIRVLWRPLNGSKPDAPSATNASIDWLISNNAPAGREDRLHYRGAGFVVLYGSGQQIRFDVRNVHLELTERVGQLKDPLGSCTLSGSFLAVRNPGIVSATLDDLKQAATTSPEPQQSTAHEGPPPRGGPTGP